MEKFVVAKDVNGNEMTSPTGRKYFVSDYGTVMLEGGEPRKIYWRRENPNITINGRNYDLKNLMWRSFKGKIRNTEKIVFADGDRYNTCLANLKRVTRAQLAMRQLQGKKKEPVRIRCIDTGFVFESVRSASQIMGINSGSICGAMKHGWKVHGYRFERI